MVHSAAAEAKFTELLSPALQAQALPGKWKPQEFVSELIHLTFTIFEWKRGSVNNRKNFIERSGISSLQHKLKGRLPIGDAEELATILRNLCDAWGLAWSPLDVRDLAQTLFKEGTHRYGIVGPFFIPQRQDALLTQMQMGLWNLADELCGPTATQVLEFAQTLVSAPRSIKELILVRTYPPYARANILFSPARLLLRKYQVELEGDFRLEGDMPTQAFVEDDPILALAMKNDNLRFYNCRLLGCHGGDSTKIEWGAKGWSLWKSS